MTRPLHLLYRWLGTALLTALLIATVEIYQAKGSFTSAHKAAFNTVMLALTILLGRNLYEGLKELAKALKDRLIQLAHGGDQQRLVEDIDSQLAVWRLLRLLCRTRESASKMLAAFCATSLSINIVAQVALSATSLTYTVDDGTNYNDTYTRRGMVNVSNLRCYYMEFVQQDCPSQVTVQTVAHTYGEMTLASRLNSTYSDIADVLQSKQDYQYYHRRTRNKQQAAYRFKEYNPDDIQKAYSYFTNRTITAEAKGCVTYDDKGPLDKKDPQNFTYVNVDDATDNGTIRIPEDFLGREGTTYIYRGFHDPTTAEAQSCGSRCIWMWAYKNPSGHPKDPSGDPNGPPEPSAFYKCPVNISDVMNANPNQPEHLIPNGTAKMAAASIALQGRYAGRPKKASEHDYHSYQFYATGSAWEIHHKDADEVGDRFSLFALGSLANMATLNPSIQIPGNVPYLGHSLRVYEPWFYILWACIVGTHLALFGAVVILTWVRGTGSVQSHGEEMDPLTSQ